jgi:D-threo-aldose 1-dehydrogenase
VVLLAGRYTLLEQTPIDSFLPLCEECNVRVVIGGPYNSGILATGADGGGFYNYAPPTEEILGRVRRIEAACRRHRVTLRAAALQFPLAHPAVASIIPGASSPAEVDENCELLREDIPDAFWEQLLEEDLIDRRCPVPDQ